MLLRKKSTENIGGHCESQSAPGNKNFCVLSFSGPCDIQMTV